MRLNRTKIYLTIVLSVALLASFPLLPREAQAWRGGGGFGGGAGGFHGGGGFGGGFGGGSFHGGGGFGGPGYGDVNVSRNVSVTAAGGWGHYGVGAGVGAAAVGAAAGLAIGATLASLPAAAQAMEVNNQTYYYDGTN